MSALWLTDSLMDCGLAESPSKIDEILSLTYSLKINITTHMSATVTDTTSAITAALKRIPPLWPLEHFVAVNPFLGFTDQPFAEASATLRRALGHAPLQSPDFYLSAWKNGTITPLDLAPFIDETHTQQTLLDALTVSKNAPPSYTVATFADALDLTIPHAHWAQFISEEIAKWCAVHFDRNQAVWVSPWKHLGLFTAWKSAAALDRKPEAFGLPGFRKFVRALPDDAPSALSQCLALLDPKVDDLADFFHRQLAGNSGWAGHVQYLVREDALRGKENPGLLELLAIRLAYDAALHSAFSKDQDVTLLWNQAPSTLDSPRIDSALSRWQSAYEAGYQKKLAADLIAQPAIMSPTRSAVQAVFCIDVRSEIIRRHLEAALPGTHTLGFAGFFGFPVAHQPALACKSAPRCPVLLVPPINSREPSPANAARYQSEKGAWKAFQNSATSCFSFVESIGLAFGAKLISRHEKRNASPAAKPEMIDLPLVNRAALAEGALRGMSLTKNFARIVLLCGHGSHSANNPFASSLDCGACGGHAGDVNARLAAATFNDPEVRALLKGKGINIPDDTIFVAGRHDTLSDDFLLYEKDSVPASHQADLATLELALVKAGAAARGERAPRLGLAHLAGTALDSSVRSRGTDIAQVRPEWALANNAALIAAPRSRTAGLKLDGRVFLHEYDPADDPESAILTVILTAPVVVASWINLQYYGSRTNPAQLAAGNKTIHQIVAGLGAIEGNAGDLLSGLPLQSIHDGKDFVHEPRRLTVIIESKPELIDAVLAAQPAVRDLFDNEWLHLIVLHEKTASQRRNGSWHLLP